MARLPCSGTLGRIRLETAIIETGMMTAISASAPTAIHGLLIGCVSFDGWEDAYIRIVDLPSRGFTRPSGGFQKPATQPSQAGPTTRPPADITPSPITAAKNRRWVTGHSGGRGTGRCPRGAAALIPHQRPIEGRRGMPQAESRGQNVCARGFVPPRARH